MDVKRLIFFAVKASAVLIALTVVGLLLSGLFYAPVTPAPRALTVSRLKQINHTFEVFRREKPSALQFFVQGTDSGKENRLKQFFIRENFIREKEDEAIYKMTVDGWGHSFNVSSRVDLATHDAAATLLQCPGDVLVWSSGRDGTNQFGHGDDVVYIPNR